MNHFRKHGFGTLGSSQKGPLCSDERCNGCKYTQEDVNNNKLELGIPSVNLRSENTVEHCHFLDSRI